MRIISISLLVLSAASMLACSNGKSDPASDPPAASIAGAWEFAAVSSNSTSTSPYTGIEVALQEGQSLVGGVEAPNGQISASGVKQISFVTITPALAPAVQSVFFGGICPLVGTAGSSLNGNVESLGGPLSFSYTENGNVFDVTGTLSTDGKSFIGTYTSAQGSACSDSGSIRGTAVSKLSGTFAGQLVMPDGTSQSVTATLSESGSTATLSILVNATSTLFSLSGPVTGNGFNVTGTYQFGGNSVLASYYGYSEQTPDPLDQTGQTTIPSIYLVNSDDPCLTTRQACTETGLLSVPQTQ